MLNPLNSIIGHGLLERTIEVLGEYGLECFVDQSRLSGAGDTCYDDQLAKRELYIYILQIITLASLERDLLSVSFSPFRRNGNT